MKPPKSRKEVRQFICVIIYYCNKCPRRSHRLAQLKRITSIARKFKLAQVKLDAFKKIKQIVSFDTLITHLDFNETFKIHTNASAFQLVVVIRQKVKPIAFYSRKHNDAQQRYTVKEKELINIL